MPRTLSEPLLIALLGLVQFILLVGFIMVMPLGPDFARALGIPTSQIGMIAGAYTAAAALSGLLSAAILDRFDRRHVLLIALTGMSLGHLAGAFAHDTATLLATRVIAGLFGGPTSALSMSIVIDSVPVERRGRALGALMGGFSLASVIGVPIGLELARLAGWHAPFWMIGGSGLLCALAIAFALPPQRAHLAAGRPTGGWGRLFRHAEALLAYATAMAGMLAGFLIIPNISAFIQFNLGYPRADIGQLYLIGGACTFFTMRLAGWIADRWGPVPTAVAATAGLIATIYVGYVAPGGVPVLVFFVVFMICNSTRNVTATSVTTAVPAAAERAGFMAVSNASQHLALATGGFLSARMLDARPDGALIGMGRVAWLAMGVALLQPVLMALLRRRLAHRHRSAVT